MIDELITKYEGLLEEQVSDARKNYHNYDRGDFMRNAAYRKAYSDFIIDLKELKRTLSLDEDGVR